MENEKSYLMIMSELLRIEAYIHAYTKGSLSEENYKIFTEKAREYHTSLVSGFIRSNKDLFPDPDSTLQFAFFNT